MCVNASRAHRVAQADAAELERRLNHLVPERVERGGVAEVDAGRSVPLDEVTELDALERLDRRRRDGEAIVQNLVERFGRHAVAVELHGVHSLEPCGLDHGDAPLSIAVEPPFDVLLRGLPRDGPVRRPRAVAREPVEPAVRLVDRPDLAVARLEPRQPRILAEVPELGYGSSSTIWRGSGQ